MPAGDVAKRPDHRALDLGMFDFELGNQALDALPLKAQIAARGTAATDDRQLAFLRIRACFTLGDVNERPDDDVLAVVGDKPGGHRLETSGEKEVEQQSFDEVVEMVSERDLRGADILGDPVQNAAAQPRAE